MFPNPLVLLFGSCCYEHQKEHAMKEVPQNNIIHYSSKHWSVHLSESVSPGTYLLCAKFTDKYPEKAPEIRFITPVSIPIHARVHVCIRLLVFFP